MSKAIEYQRGQRFDGSRLTFIEEVERSDGTRCRRMAKFLCDCGSTTVTLIESWKFLNTKSCGCANTKHGMAGTSAYRRWEGMVDRTTPGDRQSNKYPSYVGIGRDPKWDLFSGFWDDMEVDQFGVRFDEGRWLGRIDHSQGYSRSNCAWEHEEDGRAEQAERMTKHTTPSGDLKDLIEVSGVSSRTAYGRIDRGWDVYSAATAPPCKKPSAVLSCDPGLMTGLCAFSMDTMDINTTITGEYSVNDFYDLVVSLFDYMDIVHVRIERFTITAATAKKSRVYESLYLIGVLQYLCYIHGVEFSFGQPSSVMKKFPDASLKKAGWYNRSEHARDATRHMCAYLLETKTIEAKRFIL